MNDQNPTTKTKGRLSIDIGERLDEAARLISDARGPVLILSLDYASRLSDEGGVDASLVIIDDGHIGTSIPAENAVGALRELFDILHSTSEASKAEGVIEPLAAAILQRRGIQPTTDNEEA